MDATTEALLRSLTAQRNHVTGILEGLDDETLRRPVLPSGWTCLGLVRHLALDVEQFWFRVVVAAELPLEGPDDPDEPDEPGWVVPEGVSSRDVFDLYREQVAEADRVIGATDLESAPAAWPDFFGDFRLPDLRAVLLHVITETACHAGHLDVVRELIDGRQWIKL